MHITEPDPIIEHGSSTNSLNHVPELQNGHSPHVCIVGAGISGLRCAENLIRHGMKVTIIEARDRIGGRVGSYIDFKL
jgi:monoamine oxidase